MRHTRIAAEHQARNKENHTEKHFQTRTRTAQSIGIKKAHHAFGKIKQNQHAAVLVGIATAF